MPRDLSANRRPSEPWLSFLTDLDAGLDGPADFHCINGFVVSQHYGFARETADLDVLTVIPPEAAERVAALAGKGSPLQTISSRVAGSIVRLHNSRRTCHQKALFYQSNLLLK